MKKFFQLQTKLSAILVFAMSLSASSAYAHHSFSIFAIEHKIELSGVLTDIRFTAPHIMMKFEASREDGTVEEWEIESMAPARWDRLGNDREFIKVGDEATFVGFPARNCRDFMALSSIEIAEKGTMVITEEIRQGSARAAIPDETDMCENWPRKEG